MSLKIYPVTKTDIICNDYQVKVNGTPVELNTARVSAIPFNRRWPGHQRDINQSELINFLSLATDEEITYEITPQKPFDSFEIRPKSLGIKTTVENGTIKFKLKKPAYFTVEPYGRNNALHIFADPLPEYNIDFNDKNVIYFGKGIHEPGNIVMKSNQTLFIDEGAVVYTCVEAIDAENIQILGRGILDNSHNKEVILYEANESNNFAAVDNAKRQHTIQIEYCTNVKIEGVTIRDSLVYNIRPIGCKNLDFSNIKIIGCWRFNSDGIDMHNCEDVLIENCFIRTYDDSICVKGFDCYYEGDVAEAVKNAMYRNGKSYDVFKNVIVRNCTIWNDWGKCLEIGAETKAEEIYNIVFENCDIIHVTGAPLDCYNVDYADVHDIIYRNINIEYDDVIPRPQIQNSDDDIYDDSIQDFFPEVITIIVEYHAEYSVGSTRRGINRDITFSNIHLYGKYPPKYRFKGCDEEHKTKNIIIEDLFWNENKISEFDETLSKIEEFTENISIK